MATVSNDQPPLTHFSRTRLNSQRGPRSQTGPIRLVFLSGNVSKRRFFIKRSVNFIAAAVHSGHFSAVEAIDR